MDKFKMIYNILTDICKVALKHKDATLNDDMGGKMMEEFKTAFAEIPASKSISWHVELSQMHVMKIFI